MVLRITTKKTHIKIDRYFEQPGRILKFYTLTYPTAHSNLLKKYYKIMNFKPNNEVSVVQELLQHLLFQVQKIIMGERKYWILGLVTMVVQQVCEPSS